MDTTGPGVNPVFENTPVATLYFCIFIVLGSMLFLNLFMGAIADNFSAQKNKVREQRN